MYKNTVSSRHGFEVFTPNRYLWPYAALGATKINHDSRGMMMIPNPSELFGVFFKCFVFSSALDAGFIILCSIYPS